MRPSIKSSLFDLKNLYVLLTIFSSGLGMSIFRQDYYPVLSIFLSIIVFVFYKLKLEIKQIGVPLLIWFIYFMLVTFSNRSFHPRFMIQIPALILNAYIIFKLFTPQGFFSYYEKALYFLTSVSLFFFVWQAVSMSSLMAVLTPFDLNDGESINAIVYTIHGRSASSFIPRNCGFTWEPGPFSVFISLALLVRFLENDLVIDRRVIVYAIGIATTQSSTGFIMLFIIALWFIYQKNKVLFFVLSPIYFTILYFIFFQISFLGNKITDQFLLAQDEFVFFSKYGAQDESGASIGRFSGFLLNLEDFKSNPILGYGGNFKETISNKYALKISSTTGLGNWLAQFGIVGSFLFLVFWVRSSIRITFIYKRKGWIFIFFLFMTAFFSFKLNFYPLFFVIMLLFYYSNIYQNRKIKSHKIATNSN